MLKRTLLTLALISNVFVGCAKKNKSVGPQATLGKPLPSDCSETVLNSINWKEDKNVFSYSVSVGTRPQDYYQVFKIEGLNINFDLTLERDRAYSIRIEKQKTDYEISTWDINFFIPSCANRASWKAAHPEYSEPRVDNIEF